MSTIPLDKRLKEWQDILQTTRQFFIDNATEVMTTTLIDSQCSEMGVDSIPANNQWLRTSPENEMKSLILQGSGDIYQIGSVFRQDENGHLHSSEFTMLEWYRVEQDYTDLLTETAKLLHCLLPNQEIALPIPIVTYQTIFQQSLQINPFEDSTDTLHAVAVNHGLTGKDIHNRSILLDFLFDYIISNHHQNCIYAIKDFPIEQASFAQVNHTESYSYAERFEIFYKHIELANGYTEISDRDEYVSRLKMHQQRKFTREINTIPSLLKKQSLPQCAGVSLGLERVLMCRNDVDDIRQVMVSSE